ncbi:cystathionine gamma-lyase [Sulfobacillus acidophilus TPY]|uniref:Cys/Met metabolism pyridoxal-phosphate-dependent protein n=1 Tax=Sulfobacillus acidophilus (strain ATCC 700253 / DSM 10332 / NAL) TaxID=679936 RepID=G8TVD0_SULAD|nr:cystathionine gamma-lyase [Sulfobacillus acidophilus TPY]AEW05849.1 Cys/Met metabolism pyridoxal-phosphate-dependent protein [Sulfobacillus acidophilus DSM 10332]
MKDEQKKGLRWTSQFIHTGHDIDPETQAVVPPIYRATTYHQPDPWNPPRWDYARSGNPTRHALEDAMAQLEHGVRGFAFASGMAALTAAFLLFDQGDHLLVTEDCQGGTQRVLRGVFQRLGIRVSYVDTSRLDQLEQALTPQTRAVLVENFSNPFLHVADIRRIAEWAHQKNLLVLVDNTFLTPYLQNPLTLGADLVIHSATKMISGHSDVTAGIIVAADEALAKRVYFIQNACGLALSPDDSYLVWRGLRTLPVRMERAQASADALARALVDTPGVTAVYYPGLPDHPGHDVAVRDMRGFGQMVTFRLQRPDWITDLVPHLDWIVIGAGLGGTETIISLPELHCHAALTPEERQAREITPDVVRVSVGLEDPHDIIRTLTEAVKAVSTSRPGAGPTMLL